MMVPAVPLHALTDDEVRAIAQNRVRFNPILRREAREELERRGHAGA